MGMRPLRLTYEDIAKYRNDELSEKCGFRKKDLSDLAGNHGVTRQLEKRCPYPYSCLILTKP